MLKEHVGVIEAIKMNSNLIVMFVLDAGYSRITLCADKGEWFLVENQMFQETHINLIEPLLTKHERKVEMSRAKLG